MPSGKMITSWHLIAIALPISGTSKSVESALFGETMNVSGAKSAPMMLERCNLARSGRQKNGAKPYVSSRLQ